MPGLGKVQFFHGHLLELPKDPKQPAAQLLCSAIESELLTHHQACLACGKVFNGHLLGDLIELTQWATLPIKAVPVLWNLT